MFIYVSFKFIIMLQITAIGHVGSDAEKKDQNGKKFTTFRIAHNDTWTDDAGNAHSNTMWIDCILNDHPKVAEFIKAGTQVAVTGSVSLRVYSSQKDRCMKAGLTIKIRNIELLGGSTDAVPSRLYTNDGVQIDVKKFYNANVANAQLMSQRGQQFKTDEYGWVSEVKDNNTATPADNGTTEPTAAATDGEPSSKKSKGKKK